MAASDGSVSAAAALNFSVTSTRSVSSPQSDMSSAAAPVGPTSRTSMSLGDEWWMPVSVTATSRTLPAAVTSTALG